MPNVASQTLETEVSMYAFPNLLLPSRKAYKREKCLRLLLQPQMNEVSMFFGMSCHRLEKLINGKSG